MPIDRTTHRFACELCKDTYESEDREDAFARAAACEKQGLEAEPLPDGTALLMRDGDQKNMSWRIATITGNEIGSGKYQQGKGHKVAYFIDGADKSYISAGQITPHIPGRLNLHPHFQYVRDGRVRGEVLERTGRHIGAHDEGVQAAAETISALLGMEIDPAWLALIWSEASNMRIKLPLIPRRSSLSGPMREAIDALCVVSGDPRTSRDETVKRYSRDINPGADHGFQTYAPHLANVYTAAWTMAYEASDGSLLKARAWMLRHANDWQDLVYERTQAWWTGEDVMLPGHALVPAPGTKAGAMTATQSKLLDALGDVQRESFAKMRGGYHGFGAVAPTWREGAIRMISMPPARRNQKTERYRPVDALVALLACHAEVTRMNPIQDINTPVLPVVCVASGKGGVGKSTVASALAHALTAAGKRALILDLDVQGPSLPVLLDLPPAQAVDGQLLVHQLEDGTGAFSPGQIFAHDRHLTMDNAQLEALLGLLAGSIDMTDYDVLVVDLPPGTSEVQHLVNRLWKPVATLMVTTGSSVAHADLIRSLSIAANPVGIIENLTRATATTATGETVEARLYDGADTAQLAADSELDYLGSLPHMPRPDQLAQSDDFQLAVTRIAARVV